MRPAFQNVTLQPDFKGRFFPPVCFDPILMSSRSIYMFAMYSQAFVCRVSSGHLTFLCEQRPGSGNNSLGGPPHISHPEFIYSMPLYMNWITEGEPTVFYSGWLSTTKTYCMEKPQDAFHAMGKMAACFLKGRIDIFLPASGESRKP